MNPVTEQMLTIYAHHSEPRDHTKLWTEMRERISLVESGELKPGWGSFSHIVGGYDAGYYGYTHLLVFAAEMYITVFKRGPLDPIIGQLYRSKILLSGGSQDEMDFLRRPPIDAIRESIVVSLETYFGPEGNLLEMKPDRHTYPAWSSVTIDITFPKEGLPGYQLALQRVCSEAAQAIEDGVKVIILPDRATGPTRVPLSVLVACGGVHHHLVLQKMCAKVALMVETREARGVHHPCVLVGYGADAVCPWLMMETIRKIGRENLIKSSMTVDELTTHYHHSIDHGILKVMSRMGISTLQSYKGAQILGLHSEVVERCFVGIASRVQGATFDLLALDAFKLHECGWPTRGTILPPGMPESGEYHWWDGGEAHINDPGGIANLKYAVCEKNRTAYDAYALNANEQAKSIHLRGLLDFRYENAMPIPIEQVEPWDEIVLSETSRPSFPQPALLTTTIIWDRATQLLVDQSGFLHSNAVEPLSKSLGCIASMYSYVIDDDVLLVAGILHERDTHKLLEWRHPRGVFESTLLSVSLPMSRNRERAYSWRRPLLVRCPSHLAPYFRNYLSAADLDDLNIEIIRNTIYKAYLEDSYEFVGTL
ncbi:hypothetical protein BKA83DRAFT_4603416 [Pisolithus microcarpus]|nr:hypothetical protein BKA83DRAFT_4603416 [Pisolithus microcarpus]